MLHHPPLSQRRPPLLRRLSRPRRLQQLPLRVNPNTPSSGRRCACRSHGTPRTHLPKREHPSPVLLFPIFPRRLTGRALNRLVQHIQLKAALGIQPPVVPLCRHPCRQLPPFLREPLPRLPAPIRAVSLRFLDGLARVRLPLLHHRQHLRRLPGVPPEHRRRDDELALHVHHDLCLVSHELLAFALAPVPRLRVGGRRAPSRRRPLLDRRRLRPARVRRLLYVLQQQPRQQ